jgi:hypothetical protein
MSARHSRRQNPFAGCTLKDVVLQEGHHADGRQVLAADVLLAALTRSQRARLAPRCELAEHRQHMRALIATEHDFVVVRVEPVIEVRSAHELERAVQHQHSDIGEPLVLECRDERAELHQLPHHVTVARVRLESATQLTEHEREVVEGLALLEVALALLHAEDARPDDQGRGEPHVDLREPAVDERYRARVGQLLRDFLDAVEAIASTELLAHRTRDAERGLEVVLTQVLGDQERVLRDAHEEIRVVVEFFWPDGVHMPPCTESAHRNAPLV